MQIQAKKHVRQSDSVRSIRENCIVLGPKERARQRRQVRENVARRRRVLAARVSVPVPVEIEIRIRIRIRNMTRTNLKGERETERVRQRLRERDRYRKRERQREREHKTKLQVENRVPGAKLAGRHQQRHIVGANIVLREIDDRAVQRRLAMVVAGRCGRTRERTALTSNTR